MKDSSLSNNQQKVKKVIIPAAGLGTRFLPATKAQPKEMLPIVDKPAIQYIIEEAVQSGITDIIIITGRGKRSIEDHFDKSYELEATLEKKQKWSALEEVQSIANLANIHYIRQKEPLGLGHAILCARAFIGEDPFAVMLGDDVIDSDIPCLQQLIQAFDHRQAPILGVQEVDTDDVSKYGIVRPFLTVGADQSTYPIAGLVEKPHQDKAPSRLAIMGRYILTPDIFSYLEQVKVGAGGEYQLTDALNYYSQDFPIYAKIFEGHRYDIGDKLGFIKATIEFAMKRPELKHHVTQYLKDLLHKE
ncbi:UTP--glucose-1-phosphate uridylyltransferase GalU [Rossellomorea aquimaris]|uniref:UTP--glucose-1-phosphate uridylyltransferase n=1 Tax=Rossellomorea aquimaris TaxID=189382 RepID=A0A5D4TR74_9BACI|nr:UTP--glucose-1-phosphate uridylyltransferase GalU [Rossellomorea aquimaris]TYS76922.1 UTP--glucose-1-phosphate uridylyltransferase GalU [Rossellomorea aquimaris]TYS83825.1 UTP--glucose-1-phosphate uridylyltransferase GalU [Rossellomorea aquimaris]